MTTLRTTLTAIVLATLSGAAAAQQNTAVVQLPTFSFFSVATTVSVPDSGGAYVGRVGRAQSGRRRFGGPLFPPQGALGSSRSVGGLSISAQIHDQREMDLALRSRAAEGSAVKLGEMAQRLAGARHDAVGGLSHIANLREQAAAQEQSEHGEAATSFERGKLAESAGKPGVAKIHYQMAARRASGPLKDEILARLDQLSQRLAAAPQRLAQ